MVKQYPDTITLKIMVFSPEGMVDAEGNYITTAGEDIVLKCRARKQTGKNTVITAGNGQIVNYSWIIYSPKHSQIFDYGTEAQITLEDGSVHTGTVKNQSNNQLNSVIWL